MKNFSIHQPEMPKCDRELSNAIDKNREKLQTALCKNRGKLSGGGGKIKKVAPKSVWIGEKVAPKSGK